MCSGGARRPMGKCPRDAGSYLGEALSLFLQEAPGRSFQGLDVFDVDEASPDLEGTLVLKAPECPGHRLPVRPDHGAKVLVGVAGGYAYLPWDLHPLALDKKEDEARKPCWDLFEGYVLHPRLVVVEPL